VQILRLVIVFPAMVGISWRSGFRTWRVLIYACPTLFPVEDRIFVIPATGMVQGAVFPYVASPLRSGGKSAKSHGTPHAGRPDLRAYQIVRLQHVPAVAAAIAAPIADPPRSTRKSPSSIVRPTKGWMASISPPSAVHDAMASTRGRAPRRPIDRMAKKLRTT